MLPTTTENVNDKQKIQISYQDKIYTIKEFAKLTGISYQVVYTYCKKGCNLGEDIITAHNTLHIQIPYQDKIYTIKEFAKLTGISYQVVYTYYKKGCNLGEDIITAYNTLHIQIPYQDKKYSILQFSELTKISPSTIRNYCNEGFRTGEEILSKYNNKKKSQTIQIPYQGSIYNGREFSRLTGISRTFVLTYYNKGFCTGEQIITAYNNAMSSYLFYITYQGKRFSVNQFAELTGISFSTLYKYHYKGIHTGEEIIREYNKSKVQISYQNKLYNRKQFSELSGLPLEVISRCYNSGIHTGEEIIDVCNKNYIRRHNYDVTRQISYQEKLLNPTQFSALSKISVSTIIAYYNKGFHTGEDIIKAYNKQKAIKMTKLPYKGQLYTKKEFSDLTGISYSTINNYYVKLGLRTGEEMLTYYDRNKC